jgi:hypothetical protein
MSPADEFRSKITASPSCFIIENEQGELVTGLQCGEALHVWSSNARAGRMCQHYPGHWVSQIPLEELLRLLLADRDYGVRWVTVDRQPAAPPTILPIDEAIQCLAATLGRALAPAPEPARHTQEREGPALYVDDAGSRAVRDVAGRLHELLDAYMPGGGAEMRPYQRPDSLARAFRDPQISECVVRYLRLGEDVDVPQLTAAFGLARVPLDDVESLYRLLRNFRAIYVGRYREAILQAAETGANLSDARAIDPETGDLDPSHALHYQFLRAAGASESEARKAATGKKPTAKRSGCAVLVVLLFAALVVVWRLAS